MKQVLLTILGLDPKPAKYSLGEEQQTVRLAPVALFGFLPPAKRPELVVAFGTEQARLKMSPELEAALTGKAQVLSTDIPSGAGAQDVDCFLSVMVHQQLIHLHAKISLQKRI